LFEKTPKTPIFNFEIKPKPQINFWKTFFFPGALKKKKKHLKMAGEKGV
jgi:hypothetical protein